MKIFITGGSSYLGQHMVPTIASKGHGVWHTWYSTPPAEGFSGTAVQIDVRNADRLVEVVSHFQPDAIIHLAASNRSENEQAMVSSIIEGAKSIRASAQAVGCRLIHMSTDVVFDGTENPYCESSPISPPHAYGRAKAEAEQEVLQYSNSVVIRPSLIYGLKIKDRSTEWIEASLNLGKNVTLFTDQIRMPVWVGTLSEACLEMINHEFSGIIHIVGSQRLSRAEMGQRMLDWWGVSNRETLSFAPTPANAPWPKELTLDTSLAQQILTTPLLGVDDVIGLLS
ncbi:MAG: sugar nucleotide-binding protein [Cyanobacteria bacterium P01_B01_bin.77]